MAQRSERKQTIEEVFSLYTVAYNKWLDEQIMRRTPWDSRELYHDLFCSDLAVLSEQLEEMLKKEQLEEMLKKEELSPRKRVASQDENNETGGILTMPDDVFKQALRLSKDSFLHILKEIQDHAVFSRVGTRPQLPISHQLALALERLGSKDNWATSDPVGLFARNLKVSRDGVMEATQRVISALCSIGKTYMQWPDAARRKEISQVMALEGFEGCVGFLDGITFPIIPPPCGDEQTYLDRYRRYSLNAQIICDCDQNITSFITGWPGSCTHGYVFKQMKLCKQPEEFFDPGQYLLADWPYQLTQTVMPVYKAPASREASNAEFNTRSAKARVRHQQAMETLKNRWASLQDMRLDPDKKNHVKPYIRWIYACMILHNLLNKLVDPWEVIMDKDTATEPSLEKIDWSLPPEDIRSHVKRRCLEHHHQRHTTGPSPP